MLKLRSDSNIIRVRPVFSAVCRGSRRDRSAPGLEPNNERVEVVGIDEARAVHVGGDVAGDERRDERVEIVGVHEARSGQSPSCTGRSRSPSPRSSYAPHQRRGRQHDVGEVEVGEVAGIYPHRDRRREVHRDPQDHLRAAHGDIGRLEGVCARGIAGLTVQQCRRARRESFQDRSQVGRGGGRVRREVPRSPWLCPGCGTRSRRRARCCRGCCCGSGWSRFSWTPVRLITAVSSARAEAARPPVRSPPATIESNVRECSMRIEQPPGIPVRRERQHTRCVWRVEPEYDPTSIATLRPAD